jgi:DHA2 family multidrug resistance protein
MRGRGFRRIDVVGISLMAVAFASLQILLQEGERDAWFRSPFIMALAIVTVLALAAFIVWELRVTTPAVDLRIVRNLSFSSGTLIMSVMGLAMFGSLILLPLFVQDLLGYTATRAGLTLMPRSLVMVLMMPVAGALYNRLGAYVMLPFGLLLSGFAAFLMARFNLDSGPQQLLVPMVVQGIGLSFLFISLATTTLSTVPRPQMQGATGLFNLAFQLGGSLGTAIVITLVDHKTTMVSASLMRYATIYNPMFMRWWNQFQAGFMARGSDPTTAHLRALAALQGLFNRQASVVAFDYAFAVIGIVFLACLPLVLLLRRGQGGNRELVASD